MKLELKHLAPYLPYGLTGISKEQYFGIETVVGYSTYGKEKSIELTTNIDAIIIEEFKPILRPLSEFGNSDDLRKVHEFIGLGKWCEQYDFYFACWFNDLANVDKLMLQAPYEISQYFFANHYDVFSLIPKKLAIDINTLKP